MMGRARGILGERKIERGEVRAARWEEWREGGQRLFRDIF